MAGSMKSNMTASGSWRAGLARVCQFITGMRKRSPRSRFPAAPLKRSTEVAAPAVRFLLDGETIVTDDSGLAVFELVRRHRYGAQAVLVAFDLIELDGEDLRRRPIEHRKAKLAKLIRVPRAGIVLNEHYEGDGEIVFQHACKLGCEGIVSKRLGSPYRSGRSPHWLKIKNPAAPAVRREAQEDWDCVPMGN